MNNKKGIGVVVASVLVILITVAAITVTWFWIVPWTQDVDNSNNVNANLRVVLEGYTAFDVEHEMAFIQIKRGADDVDLVALDIIFNINGSSFVFRTYGAPNNNQMETYVFNFSKAGISEAPQFVEVAGVYSNKEIGVAMGEVAVPVTKVYLDDWDAVGVKADKNYLKREIIEHEIIGEPITGCKSDFVFGEVYSLTNDLNVDGDCFVINVDNVILNLAGYKITGSYSGYGVHITSDNVTVQNGYIDKFERGVFIEGLKEEDNNTIRDNSFFDNNNSVYIWLSNGNYVGGNRMDRGNYSNIYLNRANNNNIENNWACASPNDIRCEDSSISNYGSGNTFHTVVNCPEVWLGVSGEGYIEC